MTLEDVLRRMSGSQKVFIVDSVREQPLFNDSADYSDSILGDLVRNDDELLDAEVTALGSLDERTIYIKVKVPRRQIATRR